MWALIWGSVVLVDWALSLSLSVSQQQGVSLSERPRLSSAAVCQDAVQRWLEVRASVLGDGLEKIPFLNRLAGLYAGAGQHQRHTEREWRVHQWCSPYRKYEIYSIMQPAASESQQTSPFNYSLLLNDKPRSCFQKRCSALPFTSV